MKQLRSYINIRKEKSTIKATDNTIKQIVKDELDRLGHDADLNHIDVSEVINMDSLFSCSYADLGPKYNDLNPDISGWDVSNVTNMGCIFYKCKKFNCDISDWDMRKVENMRSMFCGCKVFNQDISQWVVSKAENMDFMFNGCTSFNKDISRWDVSNVTKYEDMFDDCPIKEEFKPKFNI